MNLQPPACPTCSSPRLWGDGLLEQSLSTLQYARNWIEVDHDELTFFNPGLLSSSALSGLADDGSVGPVRYLRDVRGRQLWKAVHAVTAALSYDLSGGEETFNLIDSIGILSAPAREVLAAVPAPVNHHCRHSSGGAREEAIHELSVLACLDRVLKDAIAARSRQLAASSVSNVSLSDALIASIHSGLNGAYVYEHFAFAHETFAAGAWLGTILRGRPALLPLFVAEIFCELKARLAKRGGGSNCASDQVLLDHAEFAIGMRRLTRLARRVVLSGIPVVVRPRWMSWPESRGRSLWGGDLGNRIARSFDDYRNNL